MKFVGETGSTAVIETTGSQFLKLIDFTITNTTPQSGGSTVGIFQGISVANPQTSNQRFTRIFIILFSYAPANSGAGINYGTIGLWNFGAEENTYDSVSITADLPRYFTGLNTGSNTGLMYNNKFGGTLMSTHSLGSSTFIGECHMQAQNQISPTTITENVISFVDVNTYLTNATNGATNPNQTAWHVYGSLTGGSFTGEIEQLGRFMYITGAVVNFNARITFGELATNGPTNLEHVFLDGSKTQGQIWASDFSFYDTGTNNRNLFATSAVPLTQPTSCSIQNSRFRTVTLALSGSPAVPYLAVPETVLWNPNTGNVTIEGLQGSPTYASYVPYRYEIGIKRQSVDIPPTTCFMSGTGGFTSAEVAKIIIPTIDTAGGNSLGISARLTGVLTIVNPDTNAMSTKFFEQIVSVSVGDTVTGLANIAVSGGDSGELGTTANINAPSNNISAVVVTPVPAVLSGAYYVQIMVAPTKGGANTDSVQFAGKLEMFWGGNEARAPSLQVG